MNQHAVQLGRDLATHRQAEALSLVWEGAVIAPQPPGLCSVSRSVSRSSGSHDKPILATWALRCTATRGGRAEPSAHLGSGVSARCGEACRQGLLAPGLSPVGSGDVLDASELMLFLSPFEIAAAIAVMAVGAAVQGSVGFGMNVVAAPILIHIDPALVPGPLLAAALVMSLMVARRDRAGINRPALFWALVGRFPGALLGTFLLVEVFSDWSLSLFLASVIMVGATLSVTPIRLPQGRGVIALGGFVSGVSGTATGVGGPPLALTLQNIPPRQLRGTMSVYFLLGASVSLVLLAAWGQFGTRHLLAVAILVPGQLLGFLLSGRLVPLLERGYTRPALLVISVASALSVLLRALI